MEVILTRIVSGHQVCDGRGYQLSLKSKYTVLCLVTSVRGRNFEDQQRRKRKETGEKNQERVDCNLTESRVKSLEQITDIYE